ncbi:ATP-binding protein [Marinoscillum pacificum]|uniref:ATP-binding protein n=1 Tax=Marinoscillum pacificum TaxID=392723 RepID=UPI00215822A0|nr:ATP-binding protein [Marinoscillum pacificum]
MHSHLQRFLIRIVFLFLLIIPLIGYSQEHPLSKSDSGIVIKSLEKYEYLSELKDWRGASEALNQVAFVYWNNNHYATAADYYERSLAFNEQVGNENGIAMIHNNLGMLYADLERFDESLDSFTKTLASRKSNKESIGVISASINLSVVLNNLERYDESIDHLMEALDIARELFDEEQMRSVYGMLSETYEKKGDVEKSLKYFELYRSFHEDINKRKIAEINQELQVEKGAKELLEIEKAQQEIEALRQQLELYEEIDEKDSINQYLNSKLSKRELALQLLEKDKQLSDMRVHEEKVEREKLEARQQFWIIFGVLIVSFFVILTLLITRHNRKITRYNEKLKSQNEEIADQKVELVKANNTKDKIFSVISHDLRSPISSLRGFFYYIDEFDVSEELKEALGGVESQLSNSATLLDNLLVWSRSQLENADPDISEIEVGSLIDQSIRLLEPLAIEKGIALANHVDKHSYIKSDERFVDITLRNLIQNAIKFTPKGGTVQVRLDHEQSATILKIKDTGVGMSSEKLKTLFDISTNKTTNGTNNEKGSGLGLIICKELIEKVGGFIEVSSELGVGTEFSLKFSN